MATKGSNGKVIGGASIIGVVALAAALVKSWEGHEAKPYRDMVGVLTVCYGHTDAAITGNGAKIADGRTYTPTQCATYLHDDLGGALSTVQRCITAPATDFQLAALTSFVFNVGPKGVCGSALQRKANAGDWAGACAELDRWVYAGGRRVTGLVNRRKAERALCEGRDP